MQVAQVMTRDVKSCLTTDSLDRPAHLMLAHDTGCVPVVDGEGRAVGVITDRDLCMASFVSGRPLHELGVERTITGRLHVCHAEDDVAAAHALMSAHAVRRLPVVDVEGRLVGLLSLADLVQATPYVRAKSERNRALEQVLGTLQAVTRPRNADLAARFTELSAKTARKPRAERTGAAAAAGGAGSGGTAAGTRRSSREVAGKRPLGTARKAPGKRVLEPARKPGKRAGKTGKPAGTTARKTSRKAARGKARKAAQG